MSIDQKFQYEQKKRLIRRVPSSEVLTKITEGNRFIVVEEDFDRSFIPKGYTLINMKHKGDSFKTLVPQSLLFFLANPGEGDPKDALDDVADFYSDAKDFEDEQIGGGSTSVQGSNWATLSRGSYHTYLINRLVKSKSGKGDSDGDQIPEFDKDVIKGLDISDKYVLDRVKGIAAVALGKTVKEVKDFGIEGLLKHMGIETAPKIEKIEKEEFKKITQMRFRPHWDAHTKNMRCCDDSHYYLKPEYENDSGWDYDLRTMTRSSKNTHKDTEIFDSRIAILEEEITAYRQKKHPIGRHDNALIRQYINLSYIARENHKAQLDIAPPEKLGESEK